MVPTHHQQTPLCQLGQFLELQGDKLSEDKLRHLLMLLQLSLLRHQQQHSPLQSSTSHRRYQHQLEEFSTPSRLQSLNQCSPSVNPSKHPPSSSNPHHFSTKRHPNSNLTSLAEQHPLQHQTFLEGQEYLHQLWLQVIRSRMRIRV